MAKKAIKSRALSDSRKAALATVSHTAFVSGTSTQAAADAIRDACGPKPNVTLYNHVREAFVVARMAASLPAQGDETEAQRIAHALKLLTKYQGFGGKAKLRDGMLGRRSKAQENAYGAARVAFSGICKLAGVAVPNSQGGGDTSKTRRKPQPAKKATAKSAANSNRPLSPKVRTGAEGVKYIQTQAKALAAFWAKNAKLDMPAEYGRAITAFHQAVFKSVND